MFVRHTRETDYEVICALGVVDERWVVQREIRCASEKPYWSARCRGALLFGIFADHASLYSSKDFTNQLRVGSCRRILRSLRPVICKFTHERVKTPTVSYSQAPIVIRIFR